MTFHALVDRAPIGSVLRARRDAWPDPAQYVAVRILRTHTGARAAGYLGRLFHAGHPEPTYVPTPVMSGGRQEDWTWHLDRHPADALGQVA